MHKRLSGSSKISFLKTTAPVVAGLALMFNAAHAFAECDEIQEEIVGKALAAAAAAKVNSVVTGSGKQMISIDACEVTSGGLVAQFKYNVIGADGLYWAAGKAKVSGKDVKELAFTQVSPNLAAASTKAGIKLASN